jgi:hypothetical protein
MPPSSPAPLHPISVTVHFDEKGRPTPLKFTWRGRTYTVASTGRRWDDDEGHHLLVMLPTGSAYELLLTPNHRWYLKRLGPAPSAA